MSNKITERALGSMSEATRKLNPQLFHEDKPNRKVSHPVPERDQAPALGGPTQGTGPGLRCAIVSFTGYRVRPLDPDNFAGSVKDLLDGLRHAGLIPGDENWRIALVTQQVKVAHFSQEQTLIEIET